MHKGADKERETNNERYMEKCFKKNVCSHSVIHPHITTVHTMSHSFVSVQEIRHRFKEITTYFRLKGFGFE